MKKYTYLLLIYICCVMKMFAQVAATDNPLPQDAVDVCVDKFFKDYTQDISSPTNVGHAVSSKYDLWTPGQTIRIKFLNGDVFFHDKVKKYINEWLKYVNLNIQYVPANEKADIRIGFMWNGDKTSWSQIGRPSSWLNPDAATMNFGIFTTESPESQFSRFILHEFGHALGLDHEHFSPASPIQWNTEVVYEYYATTQNWTKDQTDAQILTKFNTTESNYSEFDPLSIMTYWIPASHTLNNITVEKNYVLSATDKSFMRQTYPAIAGALSPISNTYVGTLVNVKNIGFSGGEPVYTVRNETTGEYISTSIGANMPNKQFSFTPTAAGSYVIITHTIEPFTERLVAGNEVRFKVDQTPTEISSADFRKEISVYPNPFVNNLNINIERMDASANYTIGLFNIVGVEIAKLPYSSKVELSPKISSGVYILKVYEDNILIYTSKIVKQ